MRVAVVLLLCGPLAGCVSSERYADLPGQERPLKGRSSGDRWSILASVTLPKH